MGSSGEGRAHDPFPAAEQATDEQAIAGLASRLDVFASGLSARERAALLSILVCAMDPITRAGLSPESARLEPSEEALLRALADEPQG